MKNKLFFFYKGARVELQGNEKEFINELEHMFIMFRPAIIKDANFYFDQLDIISDNINNGCSVSDEYMHVFMMNVYFLCKLGLLKEDDNNGMMYMSVKN